MFAKNVWCYATKVVLFDCVQETCNPRGRYDPGQQLLKPITGLCILVRRMVLKSVSNSLLSPSCYYYYYQYYNYYAYYYDY